MTAKLSKRVYEVPGEDVANELVDWFNAVDLTYRTELLRWMFGFWVTTLLGMAGLLIALRGH